MVEVVRERDQVPGGEFVEFVVYRSPKDGDTILGYTNFDRQTGDREVTFVNSGYGVPVREAYQAAIGFAAANNVPTIWVNDPETLFDPNDT